MKQVDKEVKMKKKILVVDDSALMRRVLCDIINSDKQFEVVETAGNGAIALEFLINNQYDVVVLDVNMPKMTGIELLKELQRKKIPVKILMASTDTNAGAAVTIEALELGALEFVHKPGSFLVAQNDDFKKNLLRNLHAVSRSVSSNLRSGYSSSRLNLNITMPKFTTRRNGNKIIAIASSTGGPKALQQIIPYLPKDINAPVVVVQHMPEGFTKSFADRLDVLSKVAVKEAEESEVLLAGCVYIARGGRHLNIVYKGGKHIIHYTNEPTREGVRPSANYMYESLMICNYDEVVCAVLTGMGADGTKGIQNLNSKKKTQVIAQNEETCAVYGMPKSIVTKGLSNKVMAIDKIAQEIIMNVGVK